MEARSRAMVEKMVRSMVVNCSWATERETRSAMLETPVKGTPGALVATIWRIWLASGMGSLVPRTMRSRQIRSEEHTSELQSHVNLVCRLLLEKKKTHAMCPGS